MTERFPSDNDTQCAWDDYLQAKYESDRTGRISDARITGKLWRRFVYLYADPENVTIDNNVVRLPARRRAGGGTL